MNKTMDAVLTAIESRARERWQEKTGIESEEDEP